MKNKDENINISKEMQEKMNKHNEGLELFDEFHDYLEELSEIEIKARMEMKDGYLSGGLNISYEEYVERFEESQEIHNFFFENMLEISNATHKIREIIASTIVFEEQHKSEIGFQKRKYITDKM